MALPEWIHSRGLEGVQHIADEIGATAVDVSGAVDHVDAIFLSVPLPVMAGGRIESIDTLVQLHTNGIGSIEWRIVEETLVSGASVSQVARLHGVNQLPVPHVQTP